MVVPILGDVRNMIEITVSSIEMALSIDCEHSRITDFIWKNYHTKHIGENLKSLVLKFTRYKPSSGKRYLPVYILSKEFSIHVLEDFLSHAKE